MYRLTGAALAAGALLCATVATAAPAPADPVTFTSPSGNIACILDAESVRCDIAWRTETPSRPPG